MGSSKRPLPVKLFIGLLAQDERLFDDHEKVLTELYGPVEMRSLTTPWSHTDYYRDELGDNILRRFIFFREVIDPERLADIKTATNQIEEASAGREGMNCRRRINIDPGYVTEAKVVLATTKDFAHRIYLAKGIYAEVELRYSKDTRTFVPLEHSYPDFGSKTSLELFCKARESLRDRIRHLIRERQSFEKECP